MSKIFILIGNPDSTETFDCGIADTYEKEAVAAGHEVRRTNLGDLTFDPILHKGYKVIQALEPDLLKVQEDMKWADHFVLIYPLWWASMPALLKGMWDRMFIPGFAFHFHKDGMGWDRLLKGKTARVIITSKNWAIIERVLFGDFKNEIGRAILGFAGYSVRITEIGRAENMSEDKKASWMKTITKLAQKGA
ncbi:MAG: Flavodoxin-like fold family protein [Parcubacteria group bacterium]|nr:Flavodoxin-like fold family protein [Parcubacteria group bacterium]